MKELIAFTVTSIFIWVIAILYFRMLYRERKRWKEARAVPE